MKIFTSQKVNKLCEENNKTIEEFFRFIRGKTCNTKGYYKCDVEKFFGKEINEGWKEL